MSRHRCPDGKYSMGYSSSSTVMARLSKRKPSWSSTISSLLINPGQAPGTSAMRISRFRFLTPTG
eukprot:7880568-Heterocapsa_arctica.AAC.1